MLDNWRWNTPNLDINDKIMISLAILNKVGHDEYHKICRNYRVSCYEGYRHPSRLMDIPEDELLKLRQEYLSEDLT
jgi:ribosomal protein S13